MSARGAFGRAAALILALAGAAVASALRAQEAATVGATSGAAFVQRSDGTVRSLAPNSVVRLGDVVSTQANSTAKLRFSDGGELSLSANSQIRIDGYSFEVAAPARDNLVMSLLKGGLRSVTGLISRRGNQDAYRLQTATATIGIRGTDYFARICVEDCTAESASTGAQAPVIARLMAARVGALEGEAIAIDAFNARRRLRIGSPVYVGDVVEALAASHAILVFLDEGKVTVLPGARLQIEKYHYDIARAESGISVMRLLRGGMRSVTGLLTKRNPNAYRVNTATSTIGIRGTGFDAWCIGSCETHTGEAAGPLRLAPGAATNGLYVTTWEGEVAVSNRLGTLPVALGQTVVVADDNTAPVYLPEMPPALREVPGPRPDSVPIDMRQLFGAGDDAHSRQGLYVLVNDGRIVLTQDNRTLELERGESAFANLERTELYRLQFTPQFLERERAVSAPTPGSVICTF